MEAIRNNRLTAMFQSLAAATMLLIGTVAAAGNEQRHAVLVGVSNYANLPPFLHLKGPANDVGLVSSMLRENGFGSGDITLLATGVAASREPTRANVLAALDALATNVEPGDLVFLYLAGHGAQQPATGSDEPDALDELFLPADVGKWSGNRQTVTNAITDNELGDRITRIRNGGAFVWAVFDTCHSGTLTRNAVPGEQWRAIDAVRYLGVPPMSTSQTENSASELAANRVDLKPQAGALVAMYASQSGERTPELDLPTGPATRARHGLFTYSLVEAISQSGDVTYRQLAQRLYSRYSAMNRQRPTPLFEGSGIDHELFGQTRRSAVREWPITQKGKTWTLAAGRLHQVTPGSVVGLFDDQAVLGYAQVESATLVTAQIRPLRRFSKPALNRRKALPETAVARIVEPEIELRSRVALPDATLLDAETAALLHRIVTLGMSAAGLSSSIVLVEPGQPAEVRLAVHDNQLLLHPASGQAHHDGAGISLRLAQPAEQAAVELSGALGKIDRALRLQRLSQYVHTTRPLVDVAVSRRPRGSTQQQPLNAGSVATLADGDEVQFRLRNDSGQAVDTTILYIDSLFGMTPIYPARAGDLNRLEPGASDVVSGVVDTSATAGRESIVVISVPAQPGAAHADFSFLADQAALASPGLRGTDEGLPGLLWQLRAGEGAKRAGSRTRQSELDRAQIEIINWRTVAAAPGG